MDGAPALPAAFLDRETDEILAHLATKPTNVLMIPKDVGMSLVSPLVRLRFRPHMQRLREKPVKRRRQPPNIHAARANHLPRTGRREQNHPSVRFIPDWPELDKPIFNRPLRLRGSFHRLHLDDLLRLRLFTFAFDLHPLFTAPARLLNNRNLLLRQPIQLVNQRVDLCLLCRSVRIAALLLGSEYLINELNNRLLLFLSCRRNRDVFKVNGARFPPIFAKCRTIIPNPYISPSHFKICSLTPTDKLSIIQSPNHVPFRCRSFIS